MLLMAIPGRIQNNPQVSARLQAQSKEVKSDIKQLSSQMKELMADIKNVQEQMDTQTATRTTKKEKAEEGNTQQTKVLDQLKEQAQTQQKQVTQQSSSQQAQLDKGKDAEVVASAMAGIMAEDELDDKAELEKTLQEKMELLTEYAEQMENVELENPDDNQQLQKMFKNSQKFKELKGRDEALSKQIEDLEINIKQQETTEKLNQVAKDDMNQKMRDQINMKELEESPKKSNQDQHQDENSNQQEDNQEDSENINGDN